MLPNVALLSIHKEYANLIFDGTKKVELRKVVPRHLSEGDLIIVYETSPQKAIIGLVEVECVLEDSPSNLWKNVRRKACISYQKYLEYYKNSSLGVAIFLKRAHRFEEPLYLSTLRMHWKGFHPPQCYKYLTLKELNLVENMLHFDISNYAGSKTFDFHQTELLSPSLPVLSSQ